MNWGISGGAARALHRKIRRLVWQTALEKKINGVNTRSVAPFGGFVALPQLAQWTSSREGDLDRAKHPGLLRSIKSS
jgi:hypothetical protein